MKSVNYNQLFSFYVVAKSGSLKTAALNLEVSQSTLSEQMKMLERDFAQKLFSREGRSLSLNGFGRRLFNKIEPLYSETTDLIEAVKLNEAKPVESVEIGITTTIAKIFAFEILEPVFKKAGTFIRVTESTPDALLLDFKEQNIDVFITHEKLSSSLFKRLRTVPLKRPNLVLVGGSQYKNLALSFPRELSGHPFFLFTTRSKLRWEIEKFFKAKKISPQVKGEIDDPEIIKSAVIDNLGLAVLPEQCVQSELNQKQIFKLGVLPQNDLHIYAHYLGGDVTPALAKVVKALETN